MINGVKRFCKVQFEDNYWIFRSLALVYVLKRPCKAILDGPLFQKPILVTVYNFQNDFLKPIGEEFCNDFETAI